MQLINKKFRGPFKGNWVLALFLLGFISRPAAIAQTPGTFTRTGDMTTMRENHTTTRLSDGRVLIAGGVTGSVSSITNTAELYDPITGVSFGPNATANTHETTGQDVQQETAEKLIRRKGQEALSCCGEQSL